MTLTRSLTVAWVAAAHMPLGCRWLFEWHSSVTQLLYSSHTAIPGNSCLRSVFQRTLSTGKRGSAARECQEQSNGDSRVAWASSPMSS